MVGRTEGSSPDSRQNADGTKDRGTRNRGNETRHERATTRPRTLTQPTSATANDGTGVPRLRPVLSAPFSVVVTAVPSFSPAFSLASLLAFLLGSASLFSPNATGCAVARFAVRKRKSDSSGGLVGLIRRRASSAFRAAVSSPTRDGRVERTGKIRQSTRAAMFRLGPGHEGVAERPQRRGILQRRFIAPGASGRGA